MAKVNAIQPDIPAGTNPVGREVVETVIRDPKEFTSYKSVNGETYTFRTHSIKDRKRVAVPRRNELALFLIAIENAQGGDGKNVMKAFNLKIKDEDNKPVFPIPATITVEKVEKEEEPPNENFDLE